MGMNATELLNHPYYDRFKEILSDPTNAWIERIQDAGKIEEGLVTMYNGLKVYKDCYYDNFSDIFWLNGGVHEPQEEFVYHHILRGIKNPMPIMLELGSYWAFYSMAFMQKFPLGKAFCVESDPNFMAQGQRNFALNGFEADFTCGFIGNNRIRVDDFCEQKGIKHLDILHSDIQSFEYEMLSGANKMLTEQRIDNIFISTHSQELHYACLKAICDLNYNLVVSVDMNESYCCDGIIVAQSRKVTHTPYNVARKGQRALWTDEQMISHLEAKKNPLIQAGSPS